MKLSFLNEIAALADKKELLARLKEQSFFETAKYAETKGITLSALQSATRAETERYPDKKNKLVYSAELYTHLQGWEQYEFVVLNIDKRGKDGSEKRKLSAVFAAEVEM